MGPTKKKRSYLAFLFPGRAPFALFDSRSLAGKRMRDLSERKSMQCPSYSVKGRGVIVGRGFPTGTHVVRRVHRGGLFMMLPQPRRPFGVVVERLAFGPDTDSQPRFDSPLVQGASRDVVHW